MKKSCAIGCAVLLILAAALVGWAMMRGPSWWQQGKGFVANLMREEARISTFESGWTPPPMQPQPWSPPALDTWTIKPPGLATMVAEWPELDVKRAGWRMDYERDGRTMEVAAVPANELEQEVLVKRAIEAAKAGGSKTTTRKSIGNGTVTLNTSAGQMTTTRGNRTHVKVGDDHTRIWWLKDWVFIFKTKGEDPADFAEEYLKAISAPAPASAPTPAPVPVEAERS